jgi:hypothetical protein
MHQGSRQALRQSKEGYRWSKTLGISTRSTVAATQSVGDRKRAAADHVPHARGSGTSPSDPG